MNRPYGRCGSNSAAQQIHNFPCGSTQLLTNVLVMNFASRLLSQVSKPVEVIWEYGYRELYQ